MSKAERIYLAASLTFYNAAWIFIFYVNWSR